MGTKCVSLYPVMCIGLHWYSVNSTGCYMRQINFTTNGLLVCYCVQIWLCSQGGIQFGPVPVGLSGDTRETTGYSVSGEMLWLLHCVLSAMQAHVCTSVWVEYCCMDWHEVYVCVSVCVQLEDIRR